jgi:hypothetical protein
VRHPSIDSEYPSRATPDESQSITDLQHRVAILPYAEDKHRDGYVVYPKHGITVPLSTPTASDHEKIRMGQMFDHYPYLEQGALHYR